MHDSRGAMDHKCLLLSVHHLLQKFSTKQLILVQVGYIFALLLLMKKCTCAMIDVILVMQFYTSHLKDLHSFVLLKSRMKIEYLSQKKR